MMFTEQFVFKVWGIVALAIVFICFLAMSFDPLSRGRIFARLIVFSTFVHLLLLQFVTDGLHGSVSVSVGVGVAFLLMLYAFYRGLFLMRIPLSLLFVAIALISAFFLFGITLGFVAESAEDAIILLFSFSVNVISNSMLGLILIFSPSLTLFQRHQRGKVGEANAKGMM